MGQPSLVNGQGSNGAVGAASGVVGGVGMLSGVNGDGAGAARAAAGGQQQQPPPPSSWAAKVRAGLGSDNSPTLGSAAGGLGGGGGIGDMNSGEMDPVVGEGMQGLPRGMGHLGPLAAGGSMGPVHGLDMEGGMPGKAVHPSVGPGQGPGSKGMVGAVGMGLGGSSGHQDSLQQGGQRGVGNGAQGLSGMTPGGGSGVEGSGALAQDFASLGMGGGALGAGSASVGGGQQGFDASKDDLLGDFPCVRLRGLAADTSVKDILDFFVGLGPALDIVLEVRRGF